MVQWDEVHEKASYYLKTEQCQKLKADGGWKASDIQPHSVITLERITAMMLYTNFTHIEHALHATYHRLHGGKESSDALKQRHSRLAKLARYLSECVQCFGTECGLSAKIAYFHVINKAVCVPPAKCYNAPLSVTTSKRVALHALYSYHHRNSDGLLVEMRGHRKSKHFECQWLSELPNECERLFMHCRRELTVQNVIDIACGLNYSFYLSAFHVLRTMLNGGDLSKLNTSMNFQVDASDVEKERAFHAIYAFLYQRFYGRARQQAEKELTAMPSTQHLPAYIDELLHSYFDELSEINISWNYLTTARRKLTSSWRSSSVHRKSKRANRKKTTFFVRILSLIQPFIVYFESDWIKWHLLIRAFPKLQTITVHSIKLHRSIFEDCLLQIKQQSRSQTSTSYSLQRIILKEAKQFELSFADVHEKYNHSFKALQWELANPKFNVFEIRRARVQLK